ncbi:hypothetical protein [Alloscardovia theropitheci]|nr:hypothetical protein [Alloscardovia theropitheci]
MQDQIGFALKKGVIMGHRRSAVAEKMRDTIFLSDYFIGKIPD